MGRVVGKLLLWAGTSYDVAEYYHWLELPRVSFLIQNKSLECAMEEILSIIIFVSALYKYKSEKMAAASVVRDDGYRAFEVWQKMHACGTVCGILSGCEWRRAVKNNNNKKKICVNIFKVIHQYFLHYFCAANMKVLYAHYIYKLLFIHVIHASVHVSEKNWCLCIHSFFVCFMLV